VANDLVLKSVETLLRNAGWHNDEANLPHARDLARRAILAGIELAATVADDHKTCGEDVCDFAPKAIAIKIRAMAASDGR
jgi:hypothetical protein